MLAAFSSISHLCNVQTTLHLNFGRDPQKKGVPHLQISVNLLVPVKKARKTGGVFGGQNLKNEEKLKKKFQKFLLSQIVR